MPTTFSNPGRFRTMAADSKQRQETRGSPSIAFIDQCLGKRSSSQMLGLLLIQIDSFSRITTAFGVEAILRWRTEDGRALSLNNYVSIAERTGSISALT